MPPSSDPTLDAARAWAEKQATDLAAQVQPTSHAPFAEVGTDISEDMARIFQVAIDYINQNDPTLPDCITMDESPTSPTAGSRTDHFGGRPALKSGHGTAILPPGSGTDAAADSTKETSMRAQGLVDEHPFLNGVRKVYRFDNNRGASVIRHQFSYGGPDGLWEIAVLDESGSLDYSTPITNDVIGRLTDDEANDVLERISQLPIVE